MFTKDIHVNQFLVDFNRLVEAYACQKIILSDKEDKKITQEIFTRTYGSKQTLPLIQESTMATIKTINPLKDKLPKDIRV